MPNDKGDIHLFIEQLSAFEKVENLASGGVLLAQVLTITSKTTAEQRSQDILSLVDELSLSLTKCFIHRDEEALLTLLHHLKVSLIWTHLVRDLIILRIITFILFVLLYLLSSLWDSQRNVVVIFIVVINYLVYLWRFFVTLLLFLLDFFFKFRFEVV